MPHVRRRYHPRDSKKLDRGTRPVSGAQSDDGCRRSQEAWRARLSLDDPRNQALPARFRSATENRDVGPAAVRSDDGAVPALGSESVLVDVRIPRGITHVNRGSPSSRNLEEELAKINENRIRFRKRRTK